MPTAGYGPAVVLLLHVHCDITSMCVHTLVILVHVHSGVTSACEHTVVILVCVHSGIISAHSGHTSACTQWCY